MRIRLVRPLSLFCVPACATQFDQKLITLRQTGRDGRTRQHHVGKHARQRSGTDRLTQTRVEAEKRTLITLSLCVLSLFSLTFAVPPSDHPTSLHCLHLYTRPVSTCTHALASHRLSSTSHPFIRFIHFPSYPTPLIAHPPLSSHHQSHKYPFLSSLLIILKRI